MKNIAPMLMLLSGALSCAAQEIPQLHADTHAIPDQVVYRILLHHAATFAAKAQELEAKGMDGSPFRRHFEQKFGLTSDEVRNLMQVATDYCAESKADEERIRTVVKQFQDDHFPGGVLRKGETPPAPPAELKKIRASRDLATLNARDRLKSVLGPASFEQFDSAVRGAFHAELRPASQNR